ncbi:MAG: hypothetical protein OEV76_10630 [Anaerolineae bacterium]|nr:hypothetical protein [Anaerolineae bacterium]
MALTAISVLSLFISLSALAAFLVGGIVLTIFLLREMELSEADWDWPQAQSRRS